MAYQFSPVRWMQIEEAPSLNFLFFSSSDLDVQCLGLHLQFSREGESSVYDQAKIWSEWSRNMVICLEFFPRAAQESRVFVISLASYLRNRNMKTYQNS